MKRGASLLGGLGLGAGLMYLLDPELGSRRRALLRDRMGRVWHRAGGGVEATAKDLTQRSRGLLAEAKARLTSEAVTDDVLVERVRAKIGRVVSHPRSIEVRADRGRVTLSGPILAREVAGLLAAVAAVRGVEGVESRLAVHEEAGSVPGLQGEGARAEPALDVLQQNWSPATRLLVGAAGGALTVFGASRRGALGAATAALGAGLLARGLTNKELRSLVGGGDEAAVEIRKTINVNVPVEVAFQFWAHYGNFPRWMSHVRDVQDAGDGWSHWVVEGPGGVPVEWDAVLTEFVPNEVIAWKSTPDAAVPQSGTVRFQPNADGSTRIDLRMSLDPPGGALGQSVAALFGAGPRRLMDEDLLRLKTLMETGVPPHDAAEKPGSGPDEYTHRHGGVRRA